MGHTPFCFVCFFNPFKANCSYQLHAVLFFAFFFFHIFLPMLWLSRFYSNYVNHMYASLLFWDCQSAAVFFLITLCCSAFCNRAIFRIVTRNTRRFFFFFFFFLYETLQDQGRIPAYILDCNQFKMIGAHGC